MKKSFICFQDLENNIRNHSDDRLEKIQEIASELVEHKIMVDSITNDVQNITERWNLLQHQVRSNLLSTFRSLSILFMHHFHAPTIFSEI